MAFATSVNIKAGFAQSGASLYIDPFSVGKTYTDIGTTFVVSVTIADVADLAGFGFNLTWDNSLLTLANVNFAADLNNIWGTGKWYVASNASGVGSYSLAALSSPLNGFSSTGSTPLCSLSFTVLDPQNGTVRNCLIHFETSDLTDPTPQPITHTVTDGSYMFEALVQTAPSSIAKCSSDVGTTFDVGITVQGIANLFSFDFTITWDSTLLTFSNCYYNATLNALWGPGNWSLADNATGPGSYRLAASSTVNGFSTTQQQTMFTLEFLVEDSLQPNNSSIHFATHILMDNSSNPIAHFVEDGTYTFGNILTVTTSPVGSGSVSESPYQTAYGDGTSVNLTATANVGWTFASWSGDFNSTANPTTINMTRNMAVTAIFTHNTYTLTVTPVGYGYVTLNNTGPSYYYGDVVQLTAISTNSSWSFSAWSGNLTGSTNPATLIITGNMNVTATFIQSPYALTISTVGNGTVTLNNNGTAITLTAIANVGWTFAGWSGDLNGTANPTTISLTRNMTITATFALNSLTINIVGNGSVSKSPNQDAYAYGTNVTLTASANAGWTFTGWGGNASGTANPVTINVTGNMVVTATFTQVLYALAVSTVGSGSVTLNNLGPYHYGDVVQLTATPAVGWSFQSWSGGLSGSIDPASLTITGNMTVTATFMPGAYTLTVNISGNGSVNENPAQTSYAYGTNVTLTATASAGWTFAGWSGGAISTANSITINVTGNMVVNATFSQIVYVLTVSAVGSGSVNLNNTGPLHYGDVVQLTAVPLSGYSFQYWSGGLTGSVNPASLTITGNVTVTATFISGGYAVTVTLAGGGSVLKSPDYASYAYGTNVVLTASANVGWTFAGWSGYVISTNNPITIDMVGNVAVTAIFFHNAYTLTVNTVGSGSVSLNDSGPYYLGDVVQLTATPAVGWSFQLWSGGLTGSVNPASLTITGNIAVTASFIQGGGYGLTVNTVGSGSVTLNDTGPYYLGDVVQLTAVPLSGYSFQYWSGSLSGSVNPALLTITGNMIVTATFAQVGGGYSLTVNTVGSGLVTLNDTGPYYNGDVVQLTAVPVIGYSFQYWSGSLSGSVSPALLTITGNMIVTATFTQVGGGYTLTVNIAGGGSVSSSPNQTSYAYGTNVTLTASANVGWTFAGWSGGVISVANPITVNMTSSLSVTATFTSGNFSLTMYIVGQGSVQPQPGNYTYPAGTSVNITAIPDPGWAFQGWTGSVNGVSNTTIIMNGNMSIIATFSQVVEGHDVAVTSIASERTSIGQGLSVNISLTIGNLGTFDETFNVTVSANATVIATFNNTALTSGNFITLGFAWNTSSFVMGDYIISAYAGPVPGDDNTTNNYLSTGPVAVTLVGDINGDFKVNLSDLILLANAYHTQPGQAKWNPNADITGNGVVDLSDFVSLAIHYERF